MRAVKLSDASSQLETLIRDVEHGETVEISRDGKPVARIVPVEASLVPEQRTPERQAEIERAIASIKAIRARSGRMTIEEIIAAKNEGRE